MNNTHDELIRDIAACKRCRLWKFRKNTVPGVGTLRAKVMLIGEAPGYHEDMQSMPFVGHAGRILDQLLTRAGLSRGDVYISNILKCRPPNNQDPTSAEMQACTPYLRRQKAMLTVRGPEENPNLEIVLVALQIAGWLARRIEPEHG